MVECVLCVACNKLENDMANYMQFKIMGSVKRIQMKPDCIPSRFGCQTDRKRKPTPTSDELQQDPKKPAVTPISEGPEAVPKDRPEVENEVLKVCRTCLASGVRMFDVAAAGLLDTFEHATRTELNSSDERPTQVCFECRSQLQRFQAFCQMSGRAEAYMTQLLKKGLQITEQAVSKRHRLIKQKLDAIHTLEDSNECDSVEVKVEVINDEPDNNSETESENEIESEVKTGTHMSERDTEREKETEEKQPEFETEGEIKIELEDIDIEEFDPFEAIEQSRDEVSYCLQCAEAFPSQSEWLKHIENHTQEKLKQGDSTEQNVEAKISKRNVKTKLEAQCKFCNMTFAIKTKLRTHLATEHGFGEFTETQKPKRRKPILKRSKEQ